MLGRRDETRCGPHEPCSPPLAHTRKSTFKDEPTSSASCRAPGQGMKLECCWLRVKLGGTNATGTGAMRYRKPTGRDTGHMCPVLFLMHSKAEPQHLCATPRCHDQRPSDIASERQQSKAAPPGVRLAPQVFTVKKENTCTHKQSLTSMIYQILVCLLRSRSCSSHSSTPVFVLAHSRRRS